LSDWPVPFGCDDPIAQQWGVIESRQSTIEEGKRCFYYDADRDSLATRVFELLADKPRLVYMPEEGRRYVLANHTRSAVGRYMLSELAGSASP